MTEVLMSLCPEKEEFVSNEKDLRISDEQQVSVNDEVRVPLTLGHRHIIVPQKNTCKIVNVPGVGKVISPRLIAVEVDDNDNVLAIRTISISGLRRIAFTEIKTALDPEPVIEAVWDSEIKVWKAAPYSYKVRALNCSPFIKGEDNRYVVHDAVTIIPEDIVHVWRPKFINQQIVVENGKVVLQRYDRFYKYSLGARPSEELVAKCLNAIEKDCTVSYNFYGL